VNVTELKLEPKFEPLLLGQVRPTGWLRRQLKIRAVLAGIISTSSGPTSPQRWIGGQAEGWERGPYWLDGVVPLAFLLDSSRRRRCGGGWITS